MEKTVIRGAVLDDAAQIRAIYAPYVEKSAITFETRIPSVEEFTRRIRETLLRYPYLVAQQGEWIIGYAYAGPFKQRASYDWSCETTVYVDRNFHGQGVGRALYKELEERLKAQGIQNMYACIAFPKEEDEYLDLGSPRFHEKLGFTRCGEFHNCANKFGRWYNMIWMEKPIADYPPDPPPVRFGSGQ